MIAAHPRTHYFSEPFNPTKRTCGAKFPLWYMYVTEEKAAYYRTHILRMLSYRYGLGRDLRSTHSPKSVKRTASNVLRRHRNRNLNLIPVVKDPISFFSAEWLAETFGMDVVVLVRHPAAFAASVMRLKWGCPFGDLAKQPELIEHFLQPFADEIHEFAKCSKSLVEQAALFWKLVYYTASQYEKAHNEWMFVRHEDVANAPVARFGEIYRTLGLEYSDDVQALIHEYTAPSNPVQAADGDSRFGKRDSKGAVKNWQRQLSRAEVDFIRRETEDVSHMFYSDGDWE